MSQQQCFIQGCNTKCKENSTAYRFPTNVVQRREWMKAIQLLNKQTITDDISPTDLVCLNHFPSICIIKSTSNHNLTMLKPNSIPSIFPNLNANESANVEILIDDEDYDVEDQYDDGEYNNEYNDVDYVANDYDYNNGKYEGIDIDDSNDDNGGYDYDQHIEHVSIDNVEVDDELPLSTSLTNVTVPTTSEAITKNMITIPKASVLPLPKTILPKSIVSSSVPTSNNISPTLYKILVPATADSPQKAIYVQRSCDPNNKQYNLTSSTKILPSVLKSIKPQTTMTNLTIHSITESNKIALSPAVQSQITSKISSSSNVNNISNQTNVITSPSPITSSKSKVILAQTPQTNQIQNSNRTSIKLLKIPTTLNPSESSVSNIGQSVNSPILFKIQIPNKNSTMTSTVTHLTKAVSPVATAGPTAPVSTFKKIPNLPTNVALNNVAHLQGTPEQSEELIRMQASFNVIKRKRRSLRQKIKRNEHRISKYKALISEFKQKARNETAEKKKQDTTECRDSDI